MRKNDIYFEPGDKVMRVASECRHTGRKSNTGKAPEFGKVYCVEDFYEGSEFNVVMLVGFGGWVYDSRGRPVGWRAINFRKVDEIKICLRAVESLKAPVQST
jgi:hypothetical protein